MEFMERRAFLKFMVVGAGAAAVAAAGDALALTSLPGPAPSAPPAHNPEAAVATPADLAQAKVENSQWVYRRRYWRPRPRYWRRPLFWRPRRWRRRRYYY
jgi:hypothetical protein